MTSFGESVTNQQGHEVDSYPLVSPMLFHMLRPPGDSMNQGSGIQQDRHL